MFNCDMKLSWDPVGFNLYCCLKKLDVTAELLTTKKDPLSINNAYENLSSINNGTSSSTFGPPYSLILSKVWGIPYAFINAFIPLAVPLVLSK